MYFNKRIYIMKKFLLAFSGATIIALVGCASPLNEGQRVYIAPSNSNHLQNCELLGQVEVEPSVSGLWNSAEQLKEMKFRLRDEAAIRYPSADTVTHSDVSVGSFGVNETTIYGTVFKCFKS